MTEKFRGEWMNGAIVSTVLRDKGKLDRLATVGGFENSEFPDQECEFQTLWHLIINNLCLFVFRNTNKIVGLLGNGIEESLIPHHINLTQVSQVTAEDYQQMIEIIKGVKEGDYQKLGLESCSIADELNKVHEKN